MKRGQTILEYMILLGFIVLVVFYMGPAIKRGLQSLIKITADQIGNQAEADQTVKRNVDKDGKVIFDENDNDSFLAEAHSGAFTNGNKRMDDNIYAATVQVDETTKSNSNSVTDLGFTKE